MHNFNSCVRWIGWLYICFTCARCDLSHQVGGNLKNQWLRLKHVYRTGPSMKVVVNWAPFWSRCDDRKSASLSISTFLIVVKKNFLNPLLINFLELKRTEMVTCSQRTTRPCRSNFCAIVRQLLILNSISAGLKPITWSCSVGLNKMLVG